MLVRSPARDRAASFGATSGAVERGAVLRGQDLGDSVHGSPFGETRRARRRQCRLEAPFGEPRRPSGSRDTLRGVGAGTDSMGRNLDSRLARRAELSREHGTEGGRRADGTRLLLREQGLFGGEASSEASAGQDAREQLQDRPRPEEQRLGDGQDGKSCTRGDCTLARHAGGMEGSRRPRRLRQTGRTGTPVQPARARNKDGLVETAHASPLRLRSEGQQGGRGRRAERSELRFAARVTWVGLECGFAFHLCGACSKARHRRFGEGDGRRGGSIGDGDDGFGGRRGTRRCRAWKERGRFGGRGPTRGTNRNKAALASAMAAGRRDGAAGRARRRARGGLRRAAGTRRGRGDGTGLRSRARRSRRRCKSEVPGRQRVGLLRQRRRGAHGRSTRRQHAPPTWVGGGRHRLRSVEVTPAWVGGVRRKWGPEVMRSPVAPETGGRRETETSVRRSWSRRRDAARSATRTGPARKGSALTGDVPRSMPHRRARAQPETW